MIRPRGATFSKTSLSFPFPALVSAIIAVKLYGRETAARECTNKLCRMENIDHDHDNLPFGIFTLPSKHFSYFSSSYFYVHRSGLTVTMLLLGRVRYLAEVTRKANNRSRGSLVARIPYSLPYSPATPRHHHHFSTLTDIGTIM